MTTTKFNLNFDQLENTLFSFAMKLTRNRDEAKDLMQETAMRAFGSKDRFRIGTNFKAWTTTIMRNTFINNYRKNRTRRGVEIPMEEMQFVMESKAVQNTGASDIMMQELNKMISDIGELYSKPFTRFYEGYSYLEIAAELDLPIGTVKSRIFFARKKLQDAIKARYNEKLINEALGN